ncbi:hypothetical protein G7046_g9427 [Stylonectria norvegica]|nr:hypothetical protein G7046_g9427 [Stylonectria norvegica]
MPAPYSDNLYSAVDSDDDEATADALSPTDGYFHASSSSDAASFSHQQQHHQHHRASSNVPLVPNVLVEDPSLPGNKAREAEAERLNSGAEAVRTGDHHPAHHHHHRRSVQEEEEPHIVDLSHARHTSSSSIPSSVVPGVRSPLFQQHQGDAPPAYTPSPTSPRTGHQTFTPSGYQTFTTSSSTMGLPEEQQRLIAREPESMGAPPEAPTPSKWQRVKDRVANFNLRKRVKTCLGVLVILSIVCALLSHFAGKPRHKAPGIVDDGPVKKPDMEDHDLIWQPEKGCLDSPHRFPKTTSMVDLRYDRNLTVLQTTEKENRDRSRWTPHIMGQVILRPTIRTSPGTIELEVISNDESLGVTVEFDKETQVFNVITPRRTTWDSTKLAPCIQIRATVWVPRESILHTFKVDTIHLDIEVKDGLILGALDGTSLRSVIGDIVSPTPNDHDHDSGVVPYTLDSRRIHIETTSGDVKGWFPLYDELAIKTASGDIRTNIAAKPADPKAPKPAVLSVHSLSGEISIKEPLDGAVATTKLDKKFPPRDYVVDVATASGDITAELAVTSKAEFVSQSGDLRLKLLPILDAGLLKGGGPKPVLVTDTKSGETKVALLEPVWTSLTTIGNIPPSLQPPKAPFNNDDNNVIPIFNPEDENLPVKELTTTAALGVLKSKHTSISGDLKLVYPASWEGNLYAQTISGSQKVRGEGLQLTHSGGSYIKRLTGKKGRGYSQLTVETVSGDEDVLVGKDVA